MGATGPSPAASGSPAGLVLPVRRLRLQVHQLGGPGDGPCVPSTEHEEPITVTRDEIIYQRRVRVLEHAAQTRHVGETRPTLGISRQTVYHRLNVAERYGVHALLPTDPRRAHPP